MRPSTTPSEHPVAPLHEAPSLLRRWTRRVTRWFLTGLIVVAPAYITGLALSWLFHHVDRPLRGAIEQVSGHDIPGAGVVSVVLLLLLTGALASNLVMRSALRAGERLLDRIPLVRTLYSGVKQLLAPLADEGPSSFQKVVLISYPDSALYALGFLIKPDAGRTADGESLDAVLVPTNHLHLGNVVLCPRSRIHDVAMSAEEALRFLVSMGAGLDRTMQIGPPVSVVPPVGAGAPQA